MPCRNRAISYLYGDLCKTQGNNDNVLRFSILQVAFSLWIPAYAGMTGLKDAGMTDSKDTRLTVGFAKVSY